MNIGNILILLRKEIAHGAKSFIFIFAVVIPLAMSQVVSLVFGTLFSESPRVGIVAEGDGDSQFVSLISDTGFLRTSTYPSEDALRSAVETGALDAGLVVPAGFDNALQNDEKVSLNLYVWGESLATNRAIITAAMNDLVIDATGRETPVNVDAVILGDGVDVPWSERLLPLLVIMALVIGGTFIPATSLVEEKTRRTLRALVTSPASLFDVFAAKGLLGAGVATLVGIMVLALNNAFGAQPALLILTFALGAGVSAAFGVILGAFIKDINTLFAVIKGIGIVLYAPALISIFPELPQWIAQLFPTYYMIHPVVEISLNGGTLATVGVDLLVMVGLIGVLLLVIVAAARYLDRREAY